LAILMQTVFSPLYGFDLQKDVINSFKATGALAYGKIVNPADDTGILALANDYGYFLMEEVTADGPSMLEMVLGDFQYEKKATANTAVTVLVPKKGNIVRTKWVSKAADGAAPAAGQKVNISSGVYVTVADNAGTKGLIKKVYTDNLNNVMYDVEIL
jgi:hypothetical protein